jgi:hypothetical protein
MPMHDHLRFLRLRYHQRLTCPPLYVFRRMCLVHTVALRRIWPWQCPLHQSSPISHQSFIYVRCPYFRIKARQTWTIICHSMPQRNSFEHSHAKTVHPIADLLCRILVLITVMVAAYPDRNLTSAQEIATFRSSGCWLLPSMFTFGNARLFRNMFAWR